MSGRSISISPDARTLFIALMALMAVTTTVGTGIAAATAPQTEQARINIEQPRYVAEPVDFTTKNGSRVYVASGKYLEIKPTNFNQSGVISFSVQESEGILSYDKGAGEYVLNTQGNSGTYHVSWTVSAHNTTTVYAATIRVVTADYAHVPQSEYKQLKKDAQRAMALVQSIKESGDPDVPVKQKVEFGNSVRNFKANPFSALSGQFIAIQTMRFMTPAGWIDLGLTVLLVYALTRGLYSTIARLRKQLEKEEQVSRREDVQRIRQYKNVLSGQMMTDVDGIDEHQAAVLEDTLGTNLFTALRNFWNVWGADNLKRMYADAMGTVGYSVRVHRDGSSEVTDVEVLEPSASPDMETATDGGEPGEQYSLANAPSDVVDALTWEDIDDRVFQKNPNVSAVDHLMVANREQKTDLIGDMNISIPEDFQSRQEFMEALARLIQHIQETEFTDAENYPREDRTVLNHLMAFTTTLDDEYDIPLDLWWRACIWNAEGLNRDDEAESVLSDITDAGETVEELDFGSGGGASGAD